MIRAGDVGGVSVTWLKTDPAPYANDKVNNEVSGDAMATGGCEEDPVVVERYNEASRTAKSIVASFTEPLPRLLERRCRKRLKFHPMPRRTARRLLEITTNGATWARRQSWKHDPMHNMSCSMRMMRFRYIKIPMMRPHLRWAHRIVLRQTPVRMKTTSQLPLTYLWSMHQVLKLFWPSNCHLERNMEPFRCSKTLMLTILRRCAEPFGSILKSWPLNDSWVNMQSMNIYWAIFRSIGRYRDSAATSLLPQTAIWYVFAVRVLRLRFVTSAKRSAYSSSYMLRSMSCERADVYASDFWWSSLSSWAPLYLRSAFNLGAKHREWIPSNRFGIVHSFVFSFISYARGAPTGIFSVRMSDFLL